MMVLEYILPPTKIAQLFHFCTGIIMFYRREEIMTVLTVNGKTAVIKASPDTPLLYVLRNDLGPKGPKLGCGLGQCGACMVLMGGSAIASCVCGRRLSCYGSGRDYPRSAPVPPLLLFPPSPEHRRR